MEPISMIIFLLLSAAAGAGTVVAYLNWSTISSWITRNQVPGGYADIIAKRLATGQFEVVAGVFGPARVQIHSVAWKARQLDPYLASRLNEVLRVQT
jgi:hypothetical protein